MALSNDLISQLVKANKEPKKATESTSYGTTVVYEGQTYVKLDGSDLLTPVSTTSSVKDGDRVTVLIKDHTATINGNISDPSASGTVVETHGKQLSEFEVIVAYKIKTDELEAITATIENLRATAARIDKLEAVDAQIESLEALLINVEHITATDMEVINAEIEHLEATFGSFTDISTEDLEAVNAEIGQLKAYTAEFTYVSAEVLEAMKAQIKDLNVENLDARYANIDFANIGEAAIKKIFSDSGLIKDLVVGDSTITGELVGVTIKGDLIEGNTVKADKLVVKGSDGIYYKLNFEAGTFASGEAVPDDSLHGSVITAKSITAEKVSVHDLVAFDATIGGFNITDHSLYSGVKESVNNTTRGVYLDSQGQVAFGDSNNYLKYFKDSDGTYKLAISANSIILGASGKSVEEAIEDASNIKVGARNLIRNSNNLIFDEYSFGDATYAVSHDGQGNTYVESNVVGANDDGNGSVNVESTILTVSENGEGDVTVASAYDGNGGPTAEMKTLTIGGITFEIVDGVARLNIATLNETIGNVSDDVSNLSDDVSDLSSEVDNTARNVSSLNETIGNVSLDVADLNESVNAAKIDIATLTGAIGVLEGLLTTDKSNIVAAINEIYKTGGSGTGGGGGGFVTFTPTLTNLLESRVITVPSGETVILRLNYSSVDDEGMDDGPGIGQLLVAGTVRQTFSVQQGEFEIDITKYLMPGTNNISVKVTNSENVPKTMTYTVVLATVSLTSGFDNTQVYSGAFTFPYTPTGMAEKTVHFELDGREIGTTKVTTSGRQVSYTIPAQSHGAHILRVWFTCVVSGATITSNVLYYSIICTTEGNTTPIIAVTTPPVSSVEQYSNVITKYRVYNPSSLTSAITLEVNGAVVNSLTVDRTEQTWSYQPTEIGALTKAIRCGTAYVSWGQTVIESNIKVEAETEALALHLTSYGRNNNEAVPGVWENNGISAEFRNFNFISDGWVLDEDDITVLRVTGDARLTIPYKIFAYDFRTTGKTLEFELATREVLNYDAEVLSCYSGGRGFVITAQQLSMASEQSSLGTRYKEDEHIRVSIVVEKRSENRLLMCYINGILSGAVQYPDDDDFSQAVPVGISIGSNDCTIDLYNIRAYDNSLTRHQILDNWIADTQKADEKLARYKRNEVYDEYGQVVISQLPNDLPYLVIQGPESPQFKDDKKTVNGYFTDPMHPEKSFSFTDTQIDVQGTSSQYYYRKNYKIKYKNGFVLHDGSTAETYQMNDKAVPTNTFTMKADVASSEGAFNVILSMLYNELCPYKTPAQIADPKVRQCIEGFPCVIFWDYGNGPEFIGKYNFNNDKGTQEVFGFKSGDESWEILQNGTDRVGWHSADFSGDSWKTDFEARYPEDNVDTTRLKALAEWLVSTDTAQATGNAITPVTYNGVTYNADTEAYRLAKFSAEFGNHFVENAVIFYYLFTEMFLSIDQREKNAFPTYLSDVGKWIVLFYDADSSCGTDNKGNLTFDYYLEDIDYTQGGDPIYNGQNSVLWKNIRATRYDEIMAMYKDLRTRTNNSISYDYVIGRFESHQSKWPEAIFNEDMYIKCIEPLINAGDGIYLPMLQGKKEMWMKWWLYNRFRYLDSKYNTGTSMTNRITIRTHAKANVSLISYVNMYGHVYYNAEMVEHRMTRGQEYEFVWAASGAEDAVIGINDADMLTSLGDLSPLMVELIDASKAIHITELKLGDAAASYRNYSLNNITLGNNILLRKLDVRNCPNLTQSVDISGCTNVEEVYFDGTSITGLKLPNGGMLKTLHLPGTMANLTLRNQTALTDLVIPGYSNITTLWLENNGDVIDPFEVLNGMPTNSRVRVIGFNKAMSKAEMYSFVNLLDSMRGMDENGNNVERAQVSGTIYIDSINPSDYTRIVEIQSRYPSLAIAYTTLVPYRVRFYNYDGTLLQTVNVETYGAAAVYTGATPVKPSNSIMEDWEFIGWMPEPTNVVDDMDCVAQFKNNASYARALLAHAITGEYVNDRVTSITASTFDRSESLTSVRFPEVTSIGVCAFAECPKLTSVDFPKVKTIGSQAFDRSPLTEVCFPSLTTIGETAYHSIGVFNSASLTKVDLPVVTEIQGLVFKNCTNLKTLIIRNPSTVCTLTTYSCFDNTPMANDTGFIYVPRDLLDSYFHATNWSVHGDRFRAIEDYPEICGGV